jgi:glycosyltransferase involved in cell wall biosynthesis
MKILFVDDDQFYAQKYISSLEAGADVTILKTAEEAWLEIRDNAANYDCISLDVMMPPPAEWSDDTLGGLFTGIEILRKCKDVLLKAQIPVFLLTNHETPTIKLAIKSVGLPDGLVTVARKIETPPSEFLDCIEALVRRPPCVPSPTADLVPASAPIPTRSQSLRAPEDLTFLSLATEWDSRHGGLSTFNRDLCLALARANHKVYCYLPDFSDKEKSSAAEGGVTLISAPQTPSLNGAERLVRRPPLPKDVNPDVIIGHDRHTGPHALIMSTDHFPKSRRIQFIHTAPFEIENHKSLRIGELASEKAEARQDQQVALCKEAAIVAAVGPRLYREIGQALMGHVQENRILPFIPGISPTPPREPTISKYAIQCLVLGRTEDKELKGLDIASRAVALATLQMPKDSFVQLVVRGAPDGEGDDLKKWMMQKASPNRIRVIVKSYTSDRETLRNDIAKAALLLMPSRAEGFGLVGLEAIDLCTPVLLSEQSGLAEFISSLSIEEGRNCIAPVNDDLKSDADVWKDRIVSVLQDRNTAFNRSRTLREKLANHMQWNNSVRDLCGAL